MPLFFITSGIFFHLGNIVPKVNFKVWNMFKQDDVQNVTSLYEIDKQDLYNYIASNKSCSVAMDGFYKEPITKETEEEFLNLADNQFLITPHNAYN